MVTAPTPEQAAALRDLRRDRRRRETALGALDRAEHALLAGIAVCRRHGVTWDAIAEVLGREQPNVNASYRALVAGERRLVGVETRLITAPAEQVGEGT